MCVMVRVPVRVPCDKQRHPRQMFAFGAATFLLWIIAPRVDHLNSGIEEIEVVEPAKPPVGNIVMEKVSQC